VNRNMKIAIALIMIALAVIVGYKVYIDSCTSSEPSAGMTMMGLSTQQNMGVWGEYSLILQNGGNTYTGTMRIDVIDAEFNTVTYNITFNPPLPYNGSTTDTMRGSIDVSNGNTTGFSLGFFTKPNLRAGDKVFGVGGGQATINETVTKEYCGQNIRVNHVYTTSGFSTENIYWVQSTGMLAEINANIMNNNDISTLSTVEARLTSSSYVPEYTTPLLVLALVSATTITAMITISRRRKRQVN
jgi:hypothetical protein